MILWAPCPSRTISLATLKALGKKDMMKKMPGAENLPVNDFVRSGEPSMPIYEYRCKECNNAFEVLVRSRGEESLLRCPACEHGEIERLLSSFSRPCAVGSSRKVNCGPKPGTFR